MVASPTICFAFVVMPVLNISPPKENRHISTLFRVQVYGRDNVLNEELYCIGTHDIDQFVKRKREDLGLENYSGYRTQAVKLSNFADSVIKSGVTQNV